MLLWKEFFIENLKRQLHERVKGVIFVHIVNGKLVIDIQTAGLQTWRCIRDDIRIIAMGFSSTTVADFIVKEYKEYILSQYFYTKNITISIDF